MMRYPNVLISILSLCFASLKLGATGLSASPKQIGTGVPGKSASIWLTLSKQVSNAIRLEARQAPLGLILKELTEKTGVKIHSSGLASVAITGSCQGESVKSVVECLLGPGANLVAKVPEKTPKARADLTFGNQASELWILSAPNVATQSNNTIVEKPAQAARRVTSHKSIAERDQDQFEETLKQTASKNPEERATALYNLGLSGKFEDPDVKDALRQALNDEDPNVREQAAASITQSGDSGLIAELNRQPKPAVDAGRMDANGNLSQDIAMLQKASKGGEKSALEFLKSRLPDSEVER